MKQIVFLFALLLLPLVASANAIAGSDIINFADPAVKDICIQNWDTNGDGELSKAEAAAVTDIGNVFSKNNHITSFDEFLYFTGVAEIKSNAFDWSEHLISITMPNGIVKIGQNAFAGCTRLTSIGFPDNEGFLLDLSSFQNCTALTTVSLPKNLTSMANNPFFRCEKLKEINVDPANPNYKSVDGVVYTKNGNEVTAYPNGKEQSEYAILNGTKSIGKTAFGGSKKLQEIRIPNTVTSVEVNYHPFDYCSSLSSIKVESGNTTFDSRDDCNAIIRTETNELILGCKGTVIPNTVTSIGNSAFYDCTALTTITIPSSVEKIGSNAFSSCYGLASFTIPNSVNDIGTGAFHYTAWYYDQPDGLLYKDNVLLGYKGNKPEGSLEIKEETRLVTGFQQCSGLTSVTFPNSVWFIGEYAFWGCTGLTSVTFPNSINSIGEAAFRECSGLTSVTFPNSVTYIGEDAFMNCSALTSITIPNSVMSIGNGAFFHCI